MADELKITVGMDLEDGTTLKQSMKPQAISIDVAGNDYIRKTQNIGTSAENLDIGDIGTVGYVLVHNTAAKGGNFVEVGYDSTGFVPSVKVRGAGWGLFEMPAAMAVPQAKADTAAVDIEYFLIEA